MTRRTPMQLHHRGMTTAIIKALLNNDFLSIVEVREEGPTTEMVIESRLDRGIVNGYGDNRELKRLRVTVTSEPEPCDE